MDGASRVTTRSDVSFDSVGERCAAWLYRPQTPSPTPCVVLAHGFAAIREGRLDAYAERFAEAGLAAVVFDYRHFGASAGEPRQLLSVRRQLADWRAAVGYARGLEGIDADRIALWGSSFSGGHVLVTAAGDPRIRAVVAQVPFVDGLSMLATLHPSQALRLTGAGLRDLGRALRGADPHMVKVVGPPGSLATMSTPDAEPGLRALNPPDVEWVDVVAARITLRVGAYRPVRQVRRIACPVLYCVADRDAVTPPPATIRAALRTPDAEVKHYPIGHFDIYLGESFEQAVTDQVAFLRRHLLER